MVSENITTGETVVKVTAIDKDFPNANITYSLEQSNDLADFMISTHTGELQVHSSLDRETQSLYVLTVHAAYINRTGLVERTSSVVTIQVTDVNDESPEFKENLYNVRNITGFSEVGELVIIVSASDADAGANGEVMYFLMPENSSFEINITTGAIYITSPVMSTLYTLNVTAMDGGEDPRSSSAIVFIHSSPYHTLLLLLDDPFMTNENTTAFVVRNYWIVGWFHLIHSPGQ